MTTLARTAHRVAALLAIVFGLLAIVFGSRYLSEHGGWDLASGGNDLMTVMLFVLGCVLTLAFALLRPGSRNVQGTRLTSLGWTAALLVALLFTWYVILVSHRWTMRIGTPVTSPQELEEFAAAHAGSFANYDYRVPTGVYLQSFEFLNASNVEMAGYVWRTYSPEIPDSVRRGVVFPEAVEEAYDATEVWRVEENGNGQIGWYFQGVFRQSFDYRLYPFDRQDIWIRLWSPEPTARVLLVPDFAAYRDLTPSTLPGIESQFVYGGWDPIRSEFLYQLLDYNVDFGLPHGSLSGPDPELFFNLSVARDPLGPLLEHLVLEAAIAILLFLLLVLMRHDSDLQDRVGLTIFDLTIAAGGLLFAVILDHNALRNAVESQQLIYMEYFPLILDVFIVLVVLSAVLRVQHWRLPILGYTGDLIPVVAYWPAMLSTLLAVTLLVFFF